MGEFDMELTQKQAEAYVRASRTGRRGIITEHCKLTGIARNTAVQRFARAIRRKQSFTLDKPPKARGAQTKYRDSHRQLLQTVYDLSGCVSAERLQPEVYTYLDELARAGQLGGYDDEVIATVRAMPVIKRQACTQSLRLRSNQAQVTRIV